MSQDLNFDGRVAIVTGAGAGLGRTYALELAKRGTGVVVHDFGGTRDGSGKGAAAPADKLVDEIKAAGGDGVANYDNVATVAGGENITKTAMDAFGKIDILINNAGILRDKSFLKMEPENWQTVLDVHLNGAYNVTRPAFGVMRENSYGRIVMTTSAAGVYGNFGQTNYAAAKMGIVGLMNVLRLEGVKYNINVNTIAPIAASRLTEDVMPPELFEKLKPEFVTPMVVYLCSDKCKVSGNIYNAGIGTFSRVHMLTGPTIMVGDGVEPPTAEAVMAEFDNINSLEGARQVDGATDLMGAAIAKATS